MPPAIYEISLAAESDLEDIFDYSAKEFGLDQAVAYLASFEDLFTKICLNPRMGRERNEIRKGLKSITQENHIVFYRSLKIRSVSPVF